MTPQTSISTVSKLCHCRVTSIAFIRVNATVISLFTLSKSEQSSSLMNLHVGTSGYSYKEWKGSFYPEKLPAKDMLSYYASRLPAVELNNTFYRLPQKSVVENWKEQVPEEFRF